MKKWGLIVIITILCLINILFFYLLNCREAMDSFNFVTSGPQMQREEFADRNIDKAKGILHVDDSCPEPTFHVSLSYDRYPITYLYIYVESENVNIYAGPSLWEPAIRKAASGERLDFLEAVYIGATEEEAERWFHVLWEDQGDKCFGFVRDADVLERWFQFDKMEAAILKVDNQAEDGKLTYINNYQNCNGYAPLYKGKTVDSEGNFRSQSAPGYLSLNDRENFIYLEDGTLVKYLFTHGEYIKVQSIYTGDVFYVPRKYIPAGHIIHDLKKIIAIDVSNQNEAVYEKKSDGWTLISYSLATTGTQGMYSQPTSLGFFFAMEKKPFFRYYEDGTTIIQGYAPYAIRFSGGAYIHGIPVNYKYNEDGSRITPPTVEYSKTIGTKPLSHKCVRNYTSHAKFLYDWYVPGETIVIVID